MTQQRAEEAELIESSVPPETLDELLLLLEAARNESLRLSPEPTMSPLILAERVEFLHELGLLVNGSSTAPDDTSRIDRVAEHLSHLGIASRDVLSVFRTIADESVLLPSLRHRPQSVQRRDRRGLTLLLGELANATTELEDQISAKLDGLIEAVADIAETATTLSDFIATSLAIFSKLSSLISIAFVRPDGHGVLNYEFMEGDALRRYRDDHPFGTIPQVTVDPSTPLGQGPGARAWRSGKIQISTFTGSDETMKPWATPYGEINIRSSMAVPLPDSSGRTQANLSLFSNCVGFFDRPGRLRSFTQLQRMMGRTVERFGLGDVKVHWQRDRYVQLLNSGHVQMMYQPLIGLRTGKVSKFEALARLVNDDGTFISPSEFLGTFGAESLLTHFKDGVSISCGTIQHLNRLGIHCEIAINLPPQGLADPRYASEFLRILAREGVDPRRITLELTEEGEVSSLERSAEMMTNLALLGVKFAQDDLGSGYSSLHRLAGFGFNEVKLDQQLVRGTGLLTMLSLIYHLTGLVRSLGMTSTVEGLETQDLIEMVAILGGDLGQGYGISKPMTLETLLARGTSATWPHYGGAPTTALGALASFFRWSRRVAELDRHASTLIVPHMTNELLESLAGALGAVHMRTIRSMVTQLCSDGAGPVFQGAVAEVETLLIELVRDAKRSREMRPATND